jgi:hypothetical protein
VKAGLRVHPTQKDQCSAGPSGGSLPESYFGTLPIALVLPHPCQSDQGICVTSIGGLSVEGSSATQMAHFAQELRQVAQSARVACFGYLPVRGLGHLTIDGGGALCVANSRPQLGDIKQCVCFACFCRSEPKVMGPLKPVAIFGSSGKVRQIIWSNQVVLGGVPKGGRWAEPSARGATVLFEVVREAEDWS